MHKKGFAILMSVLLVLTATYSIMQAKAITWSVNTMRLTTYAYFDGFPALGQTRDGRIWFVWAKEIESNLTLYYKISSNQGKTWSEEMNLTNILAPGENQNPSIIQAQNGTVWVAWTSNRPPPPAPPLPDFYMDASPQNITIPQGASENSTIIVTSTNDFSEAVDLSVFNEITGVTTTFDPTQVTPPANGKANSTLTVSVDAAATPGNYTLTIHGRSNKLLRTANIYLEITVAGEAGQTNAGVQTVLSPTSASSSIEDYEIYYKTSNDNGETWSKDHQLTNNGVDDLCPAIIQLTNSTIMIAWQSYTTDNHDIVYKTTTDGVSWSDTKQLTTDPAKDKAPAVTQTKDGKIWVVWASTRNVDYDYEIYYKTYDGVSWCADQRLTTNTNSDIQPAIVQAINEDIMIFWASGNPTGTYDICYKMSSDNGSQWSDKEVFVDSGYEDVWPAVMRTRDTRIWVAWYNNEADQPDGNWEIYCKASLAGDVNEDNNINVWDLTIVSLSYGYMVGEQGYNPVADINKDGVVDMRDLVIVAFYLGET